MDVLDKVVTWLSDVASEAMGTILVGIRTLVFSLCSYIYGLIINLYELFEVLCNARILDSGVLEEISNRVGIVLGLIMLFYVLFSCVKMLIDPDKISDKESGAGAIVKKVIIVIVLLGISNFGFKMLYNIQVLIIQNHVISKLILPYQPSEQDMDKFGNYLSEQLFLSFYYVDNFDTSGISPDDENKIAMCSNVVESFQLQIRNHGRFEMGYTCLNESVPISITLNSGQVQQDETWVVNFNLILAPVVGVIVAYLLIMYCFSVGVRMIQLAFLEIISPVAIVGYLAPKKDNMLSKWAGIYFSTYIDAFIRIAIINFVVFIIFVILANNTITLFATDTFWNSVGDPQDFKTRSVFMVVVIISLLTFAKNAPELIKEIMPSTGKSKLSFGAKIKDFVGLQQGIGMAAGAGTAAAVGLLGGVAAGKGLGKLTGAFSGALGGAFRGGRAGFGAKGLGNAISTARKNQVSFNSRKAEAIANGSTFLGRQIAGVQTALGVSTAGKRDKAAVDRLNNAAKIQDQIEATADNEKHIKELKKRYEAVKEAGRLDGEDDNAYWRRIKAEEDRWKNARKQFISNSMSGAATGDNATLIKQYQKQLNRELSSDGALFGGRGPVTNFDELDETTIFIKNRASGMQTTEDYASNQADDKFASGK